MWDADCAVSTFSRRLFLFAGAGSGVLAVTAGVLRRIKPSKSKTTPGVAQVDSQDEALRSRALLDEQALARQVGTTLALLGAKTGPDAAARAVLTALQAHHNDHTRFLRSAAKSLPRAIPAALAEAAHPRQDPPISLEPSPIVSPTASDTASPTPSPTPTKKPTPKPSPRPSPHPSRSPSPTPTPHRPLPPPSPSPTLSRSEREALTSLISAERTAQQRRRTDCLEAGAELARVLASLGASSAVHVELLTAMAAR